MKDDAAFHRTDEMPHAVAAVDAELWSLTAGTRGGDGAEGSEARYLLAALLRDKDARDELRDALDLARHREALQRIASTPEDNYWTRTARRALGLRSDASVDASEWTRPAPSRGHAIDLAMTALEFVRDTVEAMPQTCPDDELGRLDMAREFAAIRGAAGEAETLLGAELLEEAAADSREPEMRGMLDEARAHASFAWETTKAVRR